MSCWINKVSVSACRSPTATNRTTGIMPQALVQIGKSEIYRRSGIQFLPFNTIYQLRALTKQQPEINGAGRSCAADARLFQLPPDR